jgi:hypothetical protein
MTLLSMAGDATIVFTKPFAEDFALEVSKRRENVPPPPPEVIKKIRETQNDFSQDSKWRWGNGQILSGPADVFTFWGKNTRTGEKDELSKDCVFDSPAPPSGYWRDVPRYQILDAAATDNSILIFYCQNLNARIQRIPKPGRDANLGTRVFASFEEDALRGILPVESAQIIVTKQGVYTFIVSKNGGCALFECPGPPAKYTDNADYAAKIRPQLLWAKDVESRDRREAPSPPPTEAEPSEKPAKRSPRNAPNQENPGEI